MKTSTLGITARLAVLSEIALAASQASAQFVATTNDPATSVFTFKPSGINGSLTASFAPDSTYFLAVFLNANPEADYKVLGGGTTAPLAATFVSGAGGINNYTLGSGAIDYTLAGGNTFDMTFHSGQLTIPFGAQAGFVTLDDVAFSGTVLKGLTFSPDTFSYSFVTGVGADKFTSTLNAQSVPEPFTMVLGCLGIGAYVRKRRQSN